MRMDAKREKNGFMERFGRNLAAERARKDMSQEELADAVGLSRWTVAAYEAGTTTPDMASATAIADVLGVSLDALAGREPPG